MSVINESQTVRKVIENVTLLCVYPTCFFTMIDGKRLGVFNASDTVFVSNGPEQPRDGTVHFRPAAA